MSHEPTRSGAARRQRRSDAEKSIDAILDATLEYAPSDGSFTMARIARAAGVSRVTLYAHFPSRADLVEAVLDRGLARASAAVDGLALHGMAALDALALVIRSGWQVLDQQSKVFALATAVLPPTVLRAYHQPFLGHIEQLIAQGQAERTIRVDLPTDWMVSAVYSLTHLAADRLRERLLPADQAAEILTETVLSLLAAEGVREAPVSSAR